MTALPPGWREQDTDQRTRRRLRPWLRLIGAVAGVAAAALGASVVVALIANPGRPLPLAPLLNGFGVSFGSRPVSDAVGCEGRSGVTISGHTFRGIGSPVPAITIVGCHDVTIEGNDFIDVAEPIYVRDSTNVTIVWNRYRNITGPHERDGSHRGNFTQWENSFGGRIAHNEGVGGDTEDIVSIYHSGGTSAADPLLIEDNRFQGTDWSSASGSGIMLGDGGGSHVVVRNNVLIDPGQVGIGVAGGSDIHVTGNTIYGQARLYSNVGIYAWAQGTDCSDIEISDNTIDFHKQDGTNSAWWNGGNCGPITGLDTTNTNSWQTPIDPALHQVTLR